MYLKSKVLLDLKDLYMIHVNITKSGEDISIFNIRT